MTYETPKDSAGAKLCGWCGGQIRQSGVGRSKDYCTRTHKEYAYRSRRDARLIANALADARPVSTTGESVSTTGGTVISPVVETGSVRVPLPVPDPVRRAVEERQAVLFLADAVAHTSVDVPPPAPAADDAALPLPEPRAERGTLPLWEDAEIGDRLAAYGIGPDGEAQAPDWDKRLKYWERKTGVPAADSGE
ncbi:hypothetical protein OG730_44040 (plasmid) [Streptomyces sp. NBC_01298]|uniref:hypothetical protein n=1 Tax=Streptomyces sp. NBC_01298 TaxID=2903817 RepID=UPI002E0E0D34|nr:hypothetical protein OG730_43935 [Streptomyces sp. NBC_01298]WSK26342.1 hypothetical protein OG730_44040 [Streptomyces sp. NBC_01298]